MCLNRSSIQSRLKGSEQSYPIHVINDDNNTYMPLTTSLPLDTAPDTTFPTPLTIGFLNAIGKKIHSKNNNREIWRWGKHLNGACLISRGLILADDGVREFGLAWVYLSNLLSQICIHILILTNWQHLSHCRCRC